MRNCLGIVLVIVILCVILVELGSVEHGGVILKILMILLSFTLFPALARDRREQKRLNAVDGYTMMQQDPRPFFLYLRDFQSDGAMVEQPAFTVVTPLTNPLGAGGQAQVSLEETHLSPFALGGPLIAIGKPGELPELGASRIFVEDSEWQHTVTDLIEKAELVILKPGYSKGVRWETDQVMRTDNWKKTVFFIQFGTEKDKDIQRVRYNKFRKMMVENYRFEFPEFNPKIKFIFFDASGEPIWAKNAQAVLDYKNIDRESKWIHAAKTLFPKTLNYLSLQQNAVEHPTNYPAGLLFSLAVIFVSFGFGVWYSVQNYILDFYPLKIAAALILPALAGFSIGWLSNKMKIANDGLVSTIAIGGAILMNYFSWVIHLYLFNETLDFSISAIGGYIDMLTNPEIALMAGIEPPDETMLNLLYFLESLVITCIYMASFLAYSTSEYENRLKLGYAEQAWSENTL